MKNGSIVFIQIHSNGWGVNAILVAQSKSINFSFCRRHTAVNFTNEQQVVVGTVLSTRCTHSYILFIFTSNSSFRFLNSLPGASSLIHCNLFVFYLSPGLQCGSLLSLYYLSVLEYLSLTEIFLVCCIFKYL